MPIEIQENKFYSAAEVASLFGVCTKTIYRRTAEGSLRGKAVGKKTYYEEGELLRFLREGNRRSSSLPSKYISPPPVEPPPVEAKKEDPKKKQKRESTARVIRDDPTCRIIEWNPKEKKLTKIQ